MTTTPEDRRIVGLDLHADDDRRVGRISAVYRYPAEVDAPHGAAVVVSGWLRKSVHLVDLEEAVVDGAAVRVPHDRHTITRGPHFQPLVGDTLSESHAIAVRDHYRGGPG